MSMKKFTLSSCGYEAFIGRVAQQANGAVWIQHGGTVVIAAVTMAPAKDFPGFLPLSVEYREHFSAAGKIPGGYFKREGKLTDKEVLTARFIDRAMRPLFAKGFFDQVQVQVTVYSVDQENPPHRLAMLAASTALNISDIPFLEPVGVAEIGRVDGKWIINPTYEQEISSDIKVIVAGTHDGICMVEGAVNELPEKEFVELLFMAHTSIKEQVIWQQEMVKETGKEKKPVRTFLDWDVWQKNMETFLTNDHISALFGTAKQERSEMIDELKKAFVKEYETIILEQEISSAAIEYLFDNVLKDKISQAICVKKIRVDNRNFGQVRPVSVEVGVLPFAHGSALFKRGNTQSLVSLTLGSGQDEQRIEDIMGGEIDGSFMLHYNFPPFSVGEVRPMRGPSRREIGHGYLAASAFRYVLPDKESFPYTIRIVSDILESDGSSSMATVCASTMAFLNGGVPIKDMVSGVAMGLLQGENGQFVVLTDISGFEDAFGLMDFKVAGTERGITSIQMDIKYKGGLPREIFENALSQAHEGRKIIMDSMKDVMSKPNDKLSDLVPQVVTLKVGTDKIGAIIGSGGKVIREIIDKTGTSIDIENDGRVKIFGKPGEGIEQAIRWVKTLAGQIDSGMIFDGIVRRTADFGLFVELVPGKDGLLHISMIPREQQRQLNQFYPAGSKLRVEVVEYDPETDRVRLRMAKNK